VPNDPLRSAKGLLETLHSRDVAHVDLHQNPAAGPMTQARPVPRAVLAAPGALLARGCFALKNNNLSTRRQG